LVAGGGSAPAKRATRYAAAEIEDDLRTLMSAGDEIGLHGIDAWRDPQKGSEEFAAIAGITKSAELGVRMHWLYFSEESPAILEQAGFSYDSTLGYNHTVGYRSGTTQVFKPMQTAQMLELPMHVMDTALFYPDYLGLSAEESTPILESFVDNAMAFGGVVTVNWHDRSIAPERLWDRPYIDLIANLRSRGAWFATAGDAVAWFRMRRSARFETAGLSQDGDPQVTVTFPDLRSEPRNLPGVTLRTHKAGSFTDRPVAVA
jgi:hypothetical protein